ncbi:MAG: hypothetical protein R6V83_01650 [Candidatus Thorarchaeota archaeon]
MNPRLTQFIGVILVFLSAAMTVVVVNSTLAVEAEITTLIASGLITWGILAFPELVIGLWLIAKGSRSARVKNIQDRLSRLVRKEGRISVDVAADELDTDRVTVVDAAEAMAKRKLPLLYLDVSSNEIVDPRAVEIEESILHLLHARRRMSFAEIVEVTEADRGHVIQALKQLSKSGNFRGTVDMGSNVVYTQEAVAELPRALTFCTNCGGKLPEPVLPGEEEECLYCGHLNVNRLDV